LEIISKKVKINQLLNNYWKVKGRKRKIIRKIYTYLLVGRKQIYFYSFKFYKLLIFDLNIMKVKMYSTPTCGYCNLAKNFFDEKGIEVEVFDVSVDEKRRQELVDKSGQMGVPVIEIGEEIVIGFDQARISQLLNL